MFRDGIIKGFRSDQTLSPKRATGSFAFVVNKTLVKGKLGNFSFYFPQRHFRFNASRKFKQKQPLGVIKDVLTN